MLFASLLFYCRVDFVGSFPNGSTRDNAIQNLMSGWSHNEPRAAGDWLASLPTDKGRERAIQNFVNQVSWQFPDLAAPFADKISDPNQRNFAIENVARQWLQIDKKAAIAEAGWLRDKNHNSVPLSTSIAIVK